MDASVNSLLPSEAGVGDVWDWRRRQFPIEHQAVVVLLMAVLLSEVFSLYLHLILLCVVVAME